MPTAPTSKPRFVGEKVKLGDTAEYIRGVTYKAGSDLNPTLKDGFVTLLRANNIQNGKLCFDDVQFVDKKKVKEKQLLRAGDTLICASSGSKSLVGKAAYVPEDMEVTFGAFCCVIRPKSIDARYLSSYFQSRSYRSAIESVSSGSNINNLKAGDFRELNIRRYGEEERAIAERFALVNSLIDTCNSQLKLFDELVKSRFVEMFGDLEHGYKCSSCKLESIAEVGSSRRVFKDELLSEGVPFYRGTEVAELSAEGSIKPNLFISKEHYERLIGSTGKPEIGDLLLPSICPGGQIWCVNTNAPFYFKDGRVLWIRPDRDAVDGVYLRHALSTMFQMSFSNIASGTTFAELKIFLLKELNVPLPELKDQKEFVSFASQVDKSRFVRDHEMNFR